MSRAPANTNVSLRVESLEDRVTPATFRAHLSQLTAAVPNDTSYASQWGLAKVGAPSAWDHTTGSTKVVVASIDTGVDYTHRDLYQNIWLNQTEIPSAIRGQLVDTNGDQLITFHDLNAPVNAPYVSDGNGNGYIDAGDLLRPVAVGGWEDGIDGPGAANGYIDDLVGWDFVNDDNEPFDDNGHGTHTAGIIGAMGNNSLGVAGVAWNVQIMAVKLITANNTADITDAPRTITYAAANGARVSNASWGTTGLRKGDALYNAIKAAGEQYGHIVVAAAMNNGINNDTHPLRSYPAAYDLPNIITVAATDANDRLPKWSNYGKVSVDLAAPGVDILSTLPGDQYGYGSGTSMAAPFVTGTIALMLSLDPAMSAAEVKLFLLDAVDPVSGLSKKIGTGGRVNTDAAVRAGV
jgi:subtilisin family serine protease